MTDYEAVQCIDDYIRCKREGKYCQSPCEECPLFKTEQTLLEALQIAVIVLGSSVRESNAVVIEPEWAKRMKEICARYAVGIDRKTYLPVYAHADDTWHSLIDDVVEQLKGDRRCK